MNKDASQQREEKRTLKVQASDIKGILREQRKSTKILNDIKELLKPDTTVKLSEQKTIAEKRNEIKQTPALLKAPVAREYTNQDNEKEPPQNNIGIGIGGVPPTKTPRRGRSNLIRGAGSAVMSRAPIAIGAIAGDTALGMMGVGDKKVTGYMEDADEKNWERMSFFEKARSGFARGVEKVGNVLGMDNISNEARFQRIQNESNYFKQKDEAPPQDTPIINTPQPKTGLAQVLDEIDSQRRQAAEVGPPRALFEQKRAEVNQAADYKAAGDTMAAAGYTTVTGRGAFKPGAKEMQPADFEQAQQAQAAREAVGRGLRQRRRGGTGESEVPVPSRPDTVELTDDKKQSQVSAKAGPNWKAKVEEYSEEFNPVAGLESKHPGISKIYLDLAKKLAPRSDSQMSIRLHEQMLRLMALERVRGKDKDSGDDQVKERGVQPEQTSTPSAATKPTSSGDDQVKVESASTAVPAPSKADSSEISTQKSEPQMGSQVESKAGPNWKAKINDYTPEFNPVAYLEQKHPGISKIYIDLAKKLAPRSDSQMSIRQHEQRLKLMALERIKGKDGESNVEAKQQAYQPTQMKDEQVESKDSVVSKATPSRNPEDEMARLQAAGAQKGLSGRISGSYEGGQLVRVKDESGKEVDVSDQLTPEQRKKVEFARQMRADNERSGDLQNQVTQSSAENRELNREAPAGQVQPVVIQNNNNMASQNFVPIQAQPRLASSFSKYQERSASY